MTSANVNSWVQQFGLEGRRSPELVKDREEIGSSDRLLPQANAMRRAWDEMGLDGILCLDGAPVVYFKELPRANQQTVRKLQRLLWNQSIAPMLVLVFPSDIQVYSGLALPAEEEEAVDSGNRLVALFDRVADVLEMRQFMRDVELGEVFRRYAPSFDPSLRVDQYLLNNLDAVRELLLEASPPELDIKIIDALLGRVVFTCYLTDRKIIQSSYFSEVGADDCSDLRDVLQKHSPSAARRLLYNLFRKLQADFNGDIFDDDLTTEGRLINDRHIEVLGRFLNGDNLTSGQMSLGFWAYDFSVIPIETISAIYEQFLGAENEEGRQESGAYYTPRFLAEVVLDLLLDVKQPLLGKRFLDPACGSGIFLVGIFNRLAEEWNRKIGKASNIRRAEALIEIIRQSLFGIDRNETACRIAAFSLYLALLDHLSPRDIQKLQARGKFLPKLVVYRSNPTTGDAGRNIIHGDFFEPQLSLFSDQTDLPQDGFDYIVGNPPWVRVADKKSAIWHWMQARDYEFPQGQSACAFVLKAPGHLREGGRICFVLPAGILLNHQDKALRFQRQWFSQFSVEHVVNLSDMSYFLFASAIRPAAIVKYSKTKPGEKSGVIEYFTPKTNVETLRADVLVISLDDRVEVELERVLSDLKRNKAPLVWKQTFWGTPRDNKFLDRLDDLGNLSIWMNSKHSESERWTLGEGFHVVGDEKPVDRPILHEIPFLPGKSVKMYVIPRSGFEKEPPIYNPQRMGKEEVYRAPHVIFPHGVSRTGKRLKVAFCGYDCSFTHSLRGIHAPANHENELRALTCALASPLALYFFFHTSANWGSERAKIHVSEYERFPFPPPELPEQREALQELAKLHRSMEADYEESVIKGEWRAEQESERLDELVYTYYGVDSWERALIEDTVNVWIPSATPHRSSKIPALAPASPINREEYLMLLLEALNTWGRGGRRKVTGRVITSSATALAVICLSRNRVITAVETENSSSAQLDRALNRVATLLPNRAGSIRWLRNVKVFDGDDLYIVKPMVRRDWTRTAALNDADDIAAAILSASHERQYGT